MAPKALPAWKIYEEQMECFGYGHALWEPAPTSEYTRINIGDVGFIREGRFHLLFSAGLPLGERKLGEDVPSTFEQLTVGNIQKMQPRDPGCVAASTSRRVGASLGVTVHTAQPLDNGADFSFELTGNRGAALTTRHSTYNEDAQFDSAFKEYTKRHYKSWDKFARDKKYGENLQPVLVSGFDMTKDFAMVAYSNNSTSVQAGAVISTPMFGSASMSTWGVWHTKCTPFVKHGPQQLEPRSRIRSAFGAAKRRFAKSNQCVFVRYYTMRLELGMVPRVIRAGAGPHDLGSGENRGDTFPELTSRSDAEPVSDDQDNGGQRDPTADGPSSELDTAIHNVPYDEEYDSWDAIADYVFQNSNAKSVLMNHKDLAGIYAMGDESDISYLLKTHKPRVVVDEDGVGEIVCEDGTLSSQAATMDSQQVDSRSENDHRTPASTTASGVSYSSLPKFTPSNTTYELVYRFASGNIPQDDIPKVLPSIFDARDYQDCMQQLPEQDLRMWVDRSDQIIDSRVCPEELRKRALGFLSETCAARRVLPMSHYFHGSLRKASNRPTAGASAGVLKLEDERKQVYAANVYRVYSGEEYKIEKYFKEVTLWKRLSHPNVLPAFGAAPDIAEFCVVSPWMPEGDLLEYLAKYPGVNRPSIMTGVVDGLSYLHSNDIIHGDLRGANILFDNTGVPKITGFGNSRCSAFSADTADTPSHSFNIRWAAPEILEAPNDDPRCPTKMSDVYAFSMVAIEIFTGKIPFPEDQDLDVQLMVMNGKRPSKPVDTARLGLSSAAWKIVEECWNKKRDKRPDMQGVAHRLRESW